MRRTLFESLHRGTLTEPAPPRDAETAALVAELDRAALRRLGRSLAIRAVDAGSCNGCELEIIALGNVLYDLERFGLKLVASPRHADVLLVTGPMTRNMSAATRLAYEAMPAPKFVVAVGDCGRDGGVFAASPHCLGGTAAVLPVTLTIPGCPPAPAALLRGLIGLSDPIGSDVVL
ncbi:MAG: hydrogenase [Acidiphilium sp. 20-67-58]|uniref:NADH-quinone oxidoreductase subunit B family protein n=1 Tax=Acidiphilium sp. 20-67-58 TaxID=1970291 RepID=UPI000BD5505B|nr:NADH-quinone oxidoreductase subunit NuoB [Acidiphilium sp. 20-67-58]OYV56778.1 MAG: hydrogenase [Acidiphilium sp. 20-67-58]